MLDIRAVRDRFPALRARGEDWIYFDNASTTQKPEVVIDRVASSYRAGCGNVHRGVHALTEETTRLYEESRAAVARFIGASDPREIVFTRNATEAIHLAAYSWAWERVGEGDEIILSEMEHHSNLIPWQFLAKEKGARLRLLGIGPDETLHPPDLEKLISSKTRFVSLIHVSNSLGVINPAGELVAVAHRHGLPVLIDGAQSVPHLPVDVKAMDCDFLAFSGHKMLAPTGVGVLYGKQARLEAMRPFLGGGGTIRDVRREGATFHEIPWKLEAGTPSVADAVGLAAAIEFLEEIGMEKVRAYEASLTESMWGELGAIHGLTIYGPDAGDKRTGVFSFNLRGVPAHRLGRFLSERGVAVRAGDHCTQPLLRSMGVSSTVRASLYLYNTAGEIARFASLLREAASFPRSHWEGSG